MSNPSDGVAMMTPVYNAFFRAAEDNGRTRRHAIDWEKLERALSGQRTSLMILCNSRNPIGRNWSADELTRILLLANEHQAARGGGRDPRGPHAGAGRGLHAGLVVAPVADRRRRHANVPEQDFQRARHPSGPRPGHRTP
ncbi:MAG: aminotransferase class I/II-fold pyridoxal phosphate-dependent enzyme [Aeriscardovia sp.]|nr:aminotransferase class I/II-fold pyridoxal phosphate-dependent enzyme [Aeriscardovia sp.]